MHTDLTRKIRKNMYLSKSRGYTGFAYCAQKSRLPCDDLCLIYLPTYGIICSRQESIFKIPFLPRGRFSVRMLGLHYLCYDPKYRDGQSYRAAAIFPFPPNTPPIMQTSQSQSGSKAFRASATSDYHCKYK